MAVARFLLLFGLIFFFFTSSSCSSSSRENPVVAVSCGALEGIWAKENSSVAAFYSIPYGAAPTGSNRWRPPQPAPCWEGLFRADTLGNACIQMDLVPFGLGRKHSEDCLNLDVYSSSLQNSSKLSPVMVFIYGGSLIEGTSTTYTNLISMVEKGGVVMVAMNYRLNAFGFLAHPALAEVDPRGNGVSGNYGILDQQLALQWVQENIHAFGGDPSRVTLIGQSSGGTSILAHMASPGSKNLFHGAISLSASPNISMSLDVAQAQYVAVVSQQTLCGNGSLSEIRECLYNLSPDEVARMLPEQFSSSPALPTKPSGQNFSGLVFVDGVTITMPLPEALAAGLNDVPLIVQTLSAEWDIFPKDIVNVMTPSEYSLYLEEHMVSHGWPASAGIALRELYQEELNVSAQYAYNVFLSDVFVQCGTTFLALNASSGFSSPVYLNLVTKAPSNPFHTAPLFPPALYPFHMWDYLAGFGAWDLFQTLTVVEPTYTPSVSDQFFGTYLMNQWLDFAYNRTVASLLPVNAGPSGAFLVNLLTEKGVAVSPDYNKERCLKLVSAPLNLDSRFWLTN